MPSSEQNRIKNHPVLQEKESVLVKFTFDGKEFFGKKGEMISSALIANGIQIFEHRFKQRIN